jgi:hypothetical protein
MRGAIPSLSKRPSWRGAQLEKKAQRQLYLYLIQDVRGKPEWKRSLGVRRHRWETNITMGLGKIGWELVD